MTGHEAWGLPHRLAVYFRAMFPIPTRALGAVVVFYSLYLLLARVYGVRPTIGRETLFGLATLFLSTLLWRLLDELKDQDLDSQLFPDRPLVRGLVRYSDIRLLALLCLLAVVALNLNRGPATDIYFAYFALFILSWQWWLFPRVVADNVWLVFLTHQTLVPVLFFYVWGVFAHNTGVDAGPGKAVAVSLLYWIPLLAWEIGRKVRAREDETAYMTYSKRWGTRRAPAIAAAAILASGAAMTAFALAHDLGIAFLVFHPLAALAAAALILRFVVASSRRTNQVRAAVEAYGTLFSLGNLILLLLPLAPWATS
jgi:4-hydroxybenzoate polyprenyltransferase